MKALVCIYNPADLFPPTLNAVRVLAREFEEVVLATTRHANEEIPDLPSNVMVKYVAANNQEARSAIKGLLYFIRYALAIWGLMTKTKFDLVLMYDPHARLSVQLSRFLFASAPKVSWYHNHDVYELHTQRKFSAGWFAVKLEGKAFRMLDVFSLPANERKKYFPMDQFKGNYFFIPNYPSKIFLDNYPTTKASPDVIRLIFQGRVSEGHGLESIIGILMNRVNGKKLQLVLKGFIQPAYKEQLEMLAAKNNVSAQVEFHGPSAYKEVPTITASCHIGIAIHQKTDIMNTTLGTSSNKIYEYAALGLPVLLYDTPHFREHLSKYPWTRFTDCSVPSLINCIREIDEQFDDLSRKAKRDFENGLNFENSFGQALDYSKHLLRSSLTVTA